MHRAHANHSWIVAAHRPLQSDAVSVPRSAFFRVGRPGKKLLTHSSVGAFQPLLTALTRTALGLCNQKCSTANVLGLIKLVFCHVLSSLHHVRAAVHFQCLQTNCLPTKWTQADGDFGIPRGRPASCGYSAIYLPANQTTTGLAGGLKVARRG